MDKQNEIQEDEVVLVEGDKATGPLLPRWLTVLLYTIFIPLAFLALVYIGYSLVVQGRLVSAITTVYGQLGRHVSSLSEPQGQSAVAAIEKHPVYGFLYCNQKLLQKDEDDARMARSLALRKACRWGTISKQREVVRKVAEAMRPDGSVEPDVLDEQTRLALQEIIRQRESMKETSYAEELVTGALIWLAEGAKTPPTGVEKRRMLSLLSTYEKKMFLGAEAKALQRIEKSWAASPDSLRNAAAQKFALMLRGEKAELTPEEQDMCIKQADEYERLHRLGQVLIARVGKKALSELIRKGRRLDHPHIYQYLTLLGHSDEEVRQTVAEGVWLLRHRYFTMRFLGVFASMTAINPVMAVETVRLTRAEHERQMRARNDRRLDEVVRLLGQLGVDYLKDSASYSERDTPEVVRKYVVHSLESLIDDDRVSDQVAKALDELKKTDRDRPGGPLLFTP